MDLPTDYDALASRTALINRAIAMHLLREGQFSVASTFLSEAHANLLQPAPTPNSPNLKDISQDVHMGNLDSEALQTQFTDMYHIP